MHQGWPSYSCCWVPDLPTTEVNSEPQIWHQSVTLLQVHYTGPLPPWKSQHFVLTGIDIYSGYGYAFPICNVSTKTICGLTECLFIVMVFHSVLLLIKKLTWQLEKYDTRSMIMEFPWSWNSLVLPCFPPSRSSYPNRKIDRMTFWGQSYHTN